MSRIIYNEGRVVGYSAYELYVKNYLANNPSGTPLSESEWLASSIGSGSAMLFRIPTSSASWTPFSPPNSDFYYADIELPEGTNLVGCSTLFAYPFWGRGVYENDSSVFAKAIAGYGSLINNWNEGTVENPTSEVSYNNAVFGLRNRYKEFYHIKDMVVFQQGDWVDAETKSAGNYGGPRKVIRPNISQPATIRILSDTNNYSSSQYQLQILVVGFANSSALYGLSSDIGTSEDGNPLDGAFLGPAAFPWACKVILCCPPDVVEAQVSSILDTELPSKVPSIVKDEGFAKVITSEDLGGWDGAYVQAYRDEDENWYLHMKSNTGNDINVPLTKLDTYQIALLPPQNIKLQEGIEFYTNGQQIGKVLTVPGTVPDESSSGTTTSNRDFVDWYNLLIDLYNNRKLDLLGSALRGAKDVNFTAGDNYIQIQPTGGTPVRLYFGSVGNVPTPTNLPDNCVVLGIGW